MIIFTTKEKEFKKKKLQWFSEAFVEKYFPWALELKKNFKRKSSKKITKEMIYMTLLSKELELRLTKKHAPFSETLQWYRTTLISFKKLKKSDFDNTMYLKEKFPWVSINDIDTIKSIQKNKRKLYMQKFMHKWRRI